MQCVNFREKKKTLIAIEVIWAFVAPLESTTDFISSNVVKMKAWSSLGWAFSRSGSFSFQTQTLVFRIRRSGILCRNFKQRPEGPDGNPGACRPPLPTYWESRYSVTMCLVASVERQTS